MNRVAFAGGVMEARHGLVCPTGDVVTVLATRLEQWHALAWHAGNEIVDRVELAAAMFAIVIDTVSMYFDGDEAITLAALQLLRRYTSTRDWNRVDVAFDESPFDDDYVDSDTLLLPIESSRRVSLPLAEAAIVCVSLAAGVNAHFDRRARWLMLDFFRIIEREAKEFGDNDITFGLLRAKALVRRQVDVMRALDGQLATPTMFTFYTLLDCGAWPPDLVQAAQLNNERLRQLRASVFVWLVVAATRDEPVDAPMVAAGAALVLITDAAMDRRAALVVGVQTARRLHVVPSRVFGAAEALRVDLGALDGMHARIFEYALTRDVARTLDDTRRTIAYARRVTTFVVQPLSPATPTVKRRRNFARLRPSS